MERRRSLRSLVWKSHTAYFALGALWPLLSGETFQMVTGPKKDMWLVKTVALLLGVIGIVIGRAGSENRITPEITTLAIGSSVSLAAVDVVNVTRRRISPVYLLDAVGNLLLVGGWLFSLAASRRRPVA